MPKVFAIDKTSEVSACRDACAASCENQAYIPLISQVKFKEAIEVRCLVYTEEYENECNRKNIQGQVSNNI